MLTPDGKIQERKQGGVPALQMAEHDLINVLRNSLYPGASDESIKIVVGYCRASGLDPMQKPVHIVPMWDSTAHSMRDVVMPGIGLYRTQAARSGQFAGVSEPEFGQDVDENIGGVQITYPAWCRVTVRRQLPSGQIAEFVAVERWKENYAVKGGKDRSIAPNAMWSRRPYAQLAKCAEAQALRKAFPEVGAAPTADEMDGSVIEYEEIRNEPRRASRPISHAQATSVITIYPEDKFMQNLPAWESAIASGRKTADEIIGMVKTKGLLTEDQMQILRDCEQPREHEQPIEGEDPK